MAAIAAQVGMRLKGVGARYYRARPAKRAVPSAGAAPTRMIPWQKVLINALFAHDAIGVRATASTHLGHEPTRAQITSARRAAHRLVAATWPVPCMSRSGLETRREKSIILCWFDPTPRLSMINS